MKYKILKGTELFGKLQELNKRAKKAGDEADKLAKELGSDERAYTTSGGFGGGIEALHFKEKPEGWRSVGNKWQGLYFPKATEKAILKRIYELPIVKVEELNSIVGFSGMQLSGMSIVRSVGMAWHKDFILMEVADGCKYTPPKDCIEILCSEYEKLKKKIK